MKRAYKTLLALYPYDFRAWFGGEMLFAFERAAFERSAFERAAFEKPAAGYRAHRRALYFRFALAELTGLVTGALAEWIAKWTGDRSTRARSLPDWRMMRPAGISRADWFAGGGPARERPGASGHDWRDGCSSDT